MTYQKSGRTSKMTLRNQCVLDKFIKKDRRMPSRELAAQWGKIIGKSVSKYTCLQNIKNPEYGFYWAKDKPPLTTNQKKTRLEWTWSANDLDKIIWSDESKFEICVGDIRMWDCMSSQGVGRLFVTDKTISAGKYIEILQNELLPSIPMLANGNGEYIFQQDSRSCYTAKIVKTNLIHKLYHY